MSAVFDLTALIHARIALATNSGPLSDRMKAGTLRMMNKSVSTSTTSVEHTLNPGYQAFTVILIQDVQCPEDLPVVG